MRALLLCPAILLRVFQISSRILILVFFSAGGYLFHGSSVIAGLPDLFSSLPLRFTVTEMIR
jgi:hypothetical protein